MDKVNLVSRVVITDPPSRSAQQPAGILMVYIVTEIEIF